VKNRASTRLAYSSDPRQQPVCRHCGKPLGTCRCLDQREEPVPARVVAKMRLEKKGRGGKSVTVLYEMPRNPKFLSSLAKELKAACGTGGKAGADTVEIQGDQRERVRTVLEGKGWTVKG
jgi:translation initiation factor 1